jgi:hypothetical protein
MGVTTEDIASLIPAVHNSVHRCCRESKKAHTGKEIEWEFTSRFPLQNSLKCLFGLLKLRHNGDQVQPKRVGRSMAVTERPKWRDDIDTALLKLAERGRLIARKRETVRSGKPALSRNSNDEYGRLPAWVPYRHCWHFC